MARRILGAFLPLLAALIATITVSFAQTGSGELCYPDCPDNLWTGYGTLNQTFTLTSCGTSCQVRVWFVTRTSTCYPSTSYTDVQIYRIEYISGSCTGCNMDSTIHEAIKYLLSNGTAPLSLPAKGFCIDTYRVSIGGCWKYVTILTPSPMTAIRPCLTSGCCLARYEVCRDAATNVVSVSTVFTSFPEASCDDDPEKAYPGFPTSPILGDITTSDCSTHCDALEISGPIGKLSTGKGQINRTNDVQILTAGPTTTILCRPDAASNGLLEIYDVTGRKVDEVSPTSDAGGTYRFMVDRSGLGTGIYYYRVSFDGASFTTGELTGGR